MIWLLYPCRHSRWPDWLLSLSSDKCNQYVWNTSWVVRESNKTYCQCRRVSRQSFSMMNARDVSASENRAFCVFLNLPLTRLNALRKTPYTLRLSFFHGRPASIWSSIVNSFHGAEISSNNRPSVSSASSQWGKHVASEKQRTMQGWIKVICTECKVCGKDAAACEKAAATSRDSLPQSFHLFFPALPYSGELMWEKRDNGLQTNNISHLWPADRFSKEQDQRARNTNPR